MITFRKRSIIEQLLRVFPSVRKRQDEGLRSAIKALMDDPDLPCVIDGVFVQDGWGSRSQGSLMGDLFGSSTILGGDNANPLTFIIPLDIQ